MNKELLLAKANFKKKKSQSITIFLLMFLSSLLVGISLLLFLDAFPNTNKYAEKLNVGDGYTILYQDLDNINDEVISDILIDYSKEFATHECLYYPVTSIPFNDGDLVTNLLITNKNAFNKKMDRTEIAIEDKSINNNYIYLPYQLYSNGTCKIGDFYKLNINGRSYEFKIKGFTNVVSFGCSTAGGLEFVLDDQSYSDISNLDLESNRAIFISYNLNEDVSPNRMSLIIRNELSKINNNTQATCSSLSDVIFYRGYMALIIGLSFLIVTAISTIVIILMLANTISNYVKENMKLIGALKALGYTSHDIILALLIQFVSISLVASIIGVVISYSLMPIFANIISIQQGFLYNVSFNFIATFIPIIFVLAVTVLVVLISTIKIHRIEAIVALREGLDGHNFKKNVIPLDKTKIGLNQSLALKTVFNNLKQNIITFIVVGFLIFICGVGLMMYENFSRNPKLEILTFETCGGVITVDSNKKDEVRKYLEERNDVSNVRRIINIEIVYGDNLDKLTSYIIDDAKNLNNKNVCYEGRLAKYDNEICVSGKFCKAYGLTIGDEIEVTYGGVKAKYLITGLLQSCNNNGREAFMTFDALEKLSNYNVNEDYFWFDSSKEDTAKILDDVKSIYGDAIITTMNFYTVVEGGLTMFKLIASFMMIAMFMISIIVILLVLYLLIKSLIHNKKIEYGILKALGYSSKDLILQTAISFMPSIIISVIVFSFVSYFAINPYMNIIMINFGLMKCDFSIPIIGMVLIGAMLILISFGFSVFESRKIKKIEPYNLLIGE